MTNASVNGSVNGSINDSINDSEKTILTLIRQNEKITRSEIKNLTKISIRSIDRILLNLKQNNVIKRIGSNKTGYWKIL